MAAIVPEQRSLADAMNQPVSLNQGVPVYAPVLEPAHTHINKIELSDSHIVDETNALSFDDS